MQTNTTYSVSAWALINGTGNGTVRLASKVACAGAADTYPWIQNNTAVVPGTWTQLAGNLVIPSTCTPTDVAIFFEGTDPAYDVYRRRRFSHAALIDRRRLDRKTPGGKLPGAFILEVLPNDPPLAGPILAAQRLRNDGREVGIARESSPLSGSGRCPRS